MKKITPTFLLILFIIQFSFSQIYLSGETYFGQNEYIEYKAGNAPIVISAPHGGVIEPADIPDRNCSGCIYVRDLNTEDLIRKMYDAIYDEFGCYPHVIINRLHRRKLDANRDIGDAADGNPIAEQSWNEFQNFIELAKDTVEANFGKGLYLDLHGHGHDIQRLELGYRITKSELQLSNSALNSQVYVDDSSIKNLVNDNLNGLTLSELLRGNDSFGQLYEDLNVLAVPSQNDPFPLSSEPYFSGGYNTERHGSKLAGTVDAIQIECNMDGIRDTESNREAFAIATADVLKNYLEKHYFGSGFFDATCEDATALDFPKENIFDIQIFPNPVYEILNINFSELPKEITSISICNSIGRIFYEEKLPNQRSIQISTDKYPKGIYFLKVRIGHEVLIQKFLNL